MNESAITGEPDAAHSMISEQPFSNETATHQDEAPIEEALSWDYRLHLLTDRFILFNLVVVFGISFGFVVLLLVVAMTIDGSWSWAAAKSLSQGLGIVVGVLVVLCVIAMGVVMLNRADMTFRIDRKGVTCLVGQRERKLNRIAMIAGVLFGSPRLLGAAMISSSREEEFVSWRDVQRLAVHRREHVICLRDSWHDVMRLYCPADRFAEIERFVLTQFERGASRRARAAARVARQPRARVSWGRCLGWLVLTLAGAGASLSWYWAFENVWPFALAALVLVVVSSVVRGGARRLLALFGAIASGGLLAALGLVAVQPIHSFTGRNLGMLWELDTGRLAIALLGALSLLGQSVFLLLRRFGPDASDSVSDDLDQDGEEPIGASA